MKIKVITQDRAYLKLRKQLTKAAKQRDHFQGKLARGRLVQDWDTPYKEEQALCDRLLDELERLDRA